MFEVGNAAPTALPLEAGDAGNGYLALAPKASRSSERASAREVRVRRRWSQGRKPGARELGD
jgi:hypothetical protein